MEVFIVMNNIFCKKVFLKKSFFVFLFINIGVIKASVEQREIISEILRVQDVDFDILNSLLSNSVPGSWGFDLALNWYKSSKADYVIKGRQFEMIINTFLRYRFPIIQNHIEIAERLKIPGQLVDLLKQNISRDVVPVLKREPVKHEPVNSDIDLVTEVLSNVVIDSDLLNEVLAGCAPGFWGFDLVLNWYEFLPIDYIIKGQRFFIMMNVFLNNHFPVNQGHIERAQELEVPDQFINVLKKNIFKATAEKSVQESDSEFVGFDEVDADSYVFDEVDQFELADAAVEKLLGNKKNQTKGKHTFETAAEFMDHIMRSHNTEDLNRPIEVRRIRGPKVCSDEDEQNHLARGLSQLFGYREEEKIFIDLIKKCDFVALTTFLDEYKSKDELFDGLNIQEGDLHYLFRFIENLITKSELSPLEVNLLLGELLANTELGKSTICPKFINSAEQEFKRANLIVCVLACLTSVDAKRDPEEIRQCVKSFITILKKRLSVKIDHEFIYGSAETDIMSYVLEVLNDIDMADFLTTLI